MNRRERDADFISKRYDNNNNNKKISIQSIEIRKELRNFFLRPMYNFDLIERERGGKYSDKLDIVKARGPRLSKF